MNKIFTSTSILFSTVCLLLYVSCQTLPTKLVIATDPTEPPLEMINDAKQISGLDIEIIQAAAKAGGFSVEIISVPWDVIFTELQNDKFDAIIAGVTITDERRRSMDFSIPYLDAGQILLVRSDSGLESLEELSGRTIGVVWLPAFPVIEKLKEENAVNERKYQNSLQAISQLSEGKIDALLIDEPVAYYYCRNDLTYKGKLKTIGVPFTKDQYGIAVKKGNDKVLAVINEGLNKIIETGENKAIIEKWIE